MQITENLRERTERMARGEGEATRVMEQVTGVLPSAVWLSAAGLSILGALALKIAGRSATANFVGQWAPTFLLIGIYNKLVRVAGRERDARAMS